VGSKYEKDPLHVRYLETPLLAKTSFSAFQKELDFLPKTAFFYFILKSEKNRLIYSGILHYFKTSVF